METTGKYDPEFAQKTLKRIEWWGAEKIFFKDLIVEGRENLNKNTDRQRIYIANHQSHMDYALAWLEFHRQGIKMPMVPAGSNLNQPFLKKIGLDLGRLGAYFIDRDLMKKDSKESTEHKKEAIKMTRGIIDDGLDLLVFPEGGRSYSGNLFEKYNVGALRSALHKQKNLDIVPIAFAYDHRVEEKFLNTMKSGNRKTLIGKIKYYGADAFAYFINRPIAKAIGCDVGNAYINVGEPKPLSDITGFLDLTKGRKIESVKKFSIEEISRLYNEIKTK